ncbi:DUF1398 domain-containing protein [Qipengyuania sp. MTN3-11]|uniref:DUF1398 domain-containing protein n=1 Tax=Qipengyuania sp. MTN3-11 TaxID=3056557 RepID=UPI0036F380F5
MTPDQRRCAEACLTGAEEDRMSFPEILQELARLGYEGYAVDFQRNAATYYLSDGEPLDLATHADGGAIAPELDAEKLSEAIREAQADGPGYSYRGFCRKARAAGCAGYMVSLQGRRVVYYGRTGETHVEHFPDGD